MQTYSQNQGTIYNIQRYSLHDGPGIRTIVFLKGCPLRCHWCSNPESQSIEPQLMDEELVGYEASVDEVMSVVMRDKVFYKTSNGGVTLSGGEPLFQWQFAMKLAETIKSEDLHLTIETAGYQQWDKLWAVAKWADLILYDLKILDGSKHFSETGVDNSLILVNLKRLKEMGKEIILRVPVIPSVNDSTDALRDICHYAQGIGIKSVELLPYHRLGEGKYKALNKSYKLYGVPALKKEKVQALVNVFLKELTIEVKII